MRHSRGSGSEFYGVDVGRRADHAQERARRRPASWGVTVHTSHHGETTLDRLAHNDAAERFLGSADWGGSARPLEVRPFAAEFVPDREVPGLPAVPLERTRLHAQLEAAVLHPVTLVCAPTGWGKTVLAASWLRAGGAP